MKLSTLVLDVEEMLKSFPWMDPHTHVDAAHLAARGLDDILLYHMAISDLYAAGCPNGARLDDDRSPDEARRRILEAIPYLPRVRNTAISWGIRIILADLYHWTESITVDNWERLDALIAERSRDPAWPREILRRTGITRTCTELWRGRDGAANDLLQYGLEWAFFARTQWGQPDIPLYELERAWNDDAPSAPISVSFDRLHAPALTKVIRTVEDVRQAMEHYRALIPYSRILATAQHISTEIQYGRPDDAAMAKALDRRSQASERERDIYSSYILHAFLAALGKRGAPCVFQFSLGAEALPFESGSRLNQATVGQLGEIIARYPSVRFQCFLSSRHGNQALCTLARELPNLSLAGYWWHNFFPGVMRQVIEERLDMLPLNKQIGFFSDAYHLDWSYGKTVLVRKQLAEVLAGKIDQGQYSMDEAASIAKAILYDSAVNLLGMIPKNV